MWLALNESVMANQADCGDCMVLGVCRESVWVCDIWQSIDHRRSFCHFCRNITTWSQTFRKSTTLWYL